MSIQDSKFINNTASLYGGCVFVEQDATLNVKKTYMDNSVHWKSGVDDILHSKGTLRIDSSEFEVKASGELTIATPHCRKSIRVFSSSG